MKHLKSTLLTLAALLCSTVASAYSFKVDGIFYNITNSSALTVAVTYESNTNSYSGDVVIPATVTYDDKVYTVTSIGQNAFSSCSRLTSITIPEGVTSIGGYAFSGCSSLADIHIGSIESWLKINYSDYYSHPNYLGKDVKLYLDGELLTEVEIPATVTSIPSYAFRNCSSLTSIILPEGVTSIGSYAFYACSSLTSIILPEGVTSIGGSAFQYCSSLTSIILPEGVTSIGGSAFRDCSRLTSIILPEGVASIGDNAFRDCSSLTSIILPEGVTSIGGYAFYNCSSLTSIILPEGVTSIGVSAFRDCSSLTSIILPESVASIGSEAFSYCNSLADIHIGSIESWLKINYSSDSSHPNYYGKDVKLYLDGELLTEVEIPATVTSIGTYAFRNCSRLTSIILPEGVTSIGGSAFSGCSSLIDVVLKSTTPPALTTSSNIPLNMVFAVPGAAYEDYLTASYWADLASQITIDDANARVKSVALTAEADKSALHVAIGDEDLKFVTDLTVSGSINSYDFMVMRNKMPLLRHLNLEDATIVANAYEHYSGYCTQDNKFPGYGLYNCKLLGLVFPKNITNVGYYGVANNAILSDVTLFEGVSSIGGYAFYNCDALTAITLPEGVTSIGSSAFYGCNALTNITMPKGLASVGNDAFRYCNMLTSITFHDGLISLGQGAFLGCSNLKTIVLPPTLEKIQGGTLSFYGTFSECSSLKEIRIPSSVRSVGDYAFYGCSSLNDVYVYTVEPISIGQNTFDKNGNNFKGTLHAPKVSYWDYFYDTQWSQFTSFAEFDEPYENFYLVGDKELDSTTGAIVGEGDKNPDAEMGNNSGLIVEDDIVQDLGNVDIEHNGTDGGSIVVSGPDGCVNTGELHFHINVKAGKWYFFCFPFDVKREDIQMRGGADWVFRYYDGKERANNGKGGWKNVTSDGNGNFLKAATGYIFQCSREDVLVLTAKNQKIKHEDKYNELVAHATENMHDASWNFVGNPYLSYYEVTSEDYSAPITVWDGSKYIAIRPGDDDYQLAPFEGFFVQKPEDTYAVTYSADRQMTYNQAQESAAKAHARRRAMPINPDRLLVNITLSNGEETDQTRVVFNNNAAMGYETACDAAKFETAGMTQLYTVDSRAVKYAINERPVAEGIVTMGYTAPAAGNYTLAAPRMDAPICIKDNLTGTVHDFSEGSYTFMTEEGTFEDRFTVMMKAGTTGIDNAEIGNQNSEIYNVKGQRVNEATEQGVYIKENRKVVKL